MYRLRSKPMRRFKQRPPTRLHSRACLLRLESLRVQRRGQRPRRASILSGQHTRAGSGLCVQCHPLRTPTQAAPFHNLPMGSLCRVADAALVAASEAATWRTQHILRDALELHRNAASPAEVSAHSSLLGLTLTPWKQPGLMPQCYACLHTPGSNALDSQPSGSHPCPILVPSAR